MKWICKVLIYIGSASALVRSENSENARDGWVDSLCAFFADKSLESRVRPPSQGRDRVGSDSGRHDERFGIVHDERRVFFIGAFD
jgi:hypothetical protein